MQRIHDQLTSIAVLILVLGGVEAFVFGWRYLLIGFLVALAVYNVASKLVERRRKRYMHYTIAIFVLAACTIFGLFFAVPGLLSVAEGRNSWTTWEY